jgi:hypothetical protein
LSLEREEDREQKREKQKSFHDCIFSIGLWPPLSHNLCQRATFSLLLPDFLWWQEGLGWCGLMVLCLCPKRVEMGNFLLFSVVISIFLTILRGVMDFFRIFASIGK